VRRLSLALLLPLGLCATTAFALDGFWTAPATRFYKTGAMCAFDTDHDRLLVMGGHSFSAGQTSEQIWSFDVDGGTGWTVLPIGSPTPGSRAFGVMLYDAPRHRLLVYGGYRAGTGEFLGDLWSRRLDGDYPWELLNDGTAGPAPRRDASFAVDQGRDRLVVFGGEGAGGLLADTWTLPLSGPAVWSQASPAGSPPTARSRAPMAYDPLRDRMVLQGGFDGASYLDDTYLLSLGGSTTWGLVPGVASWLNEPSTEHTYAMYYDESADVMRLIGGNLTYSPVVQTLTLAPSLSWQKNTVSGTPSMRIGELIAHDPVGHRDVLYGGYAQFSTPKFATDVYTLAGNGVGGPLWNRVFYPGDSGPPSRAGAGMVYDAAGKRLMLVGGAPYGETSSPVMQYRQVATDPLGLWTNPVSSTQNNRVNFALARDETRNRLILIGGRMSNGSTLYSSVMAFNVNSGVWAYPTPTGSIPPVVDGRAVYDLPNDRIVFFDPGSGLTWELPFSISPLSPPWTPITTANPGPSGHTGAMAVRDPVRNRLLVVGGESLASGSLDELWALSLGGTPDWSMTALGGTAPPARADGVLVYDSIRDRLVLFGGRAPDGGKLTDAWALPLDGTNQWSPLELAGPVPSGRDWAVGAFDPDLDHVVIWGGDTTNAVPMDSVGDLHYIQFASWLAVQPHAGGGALAFTAGPNPARRAVTVRLARPTGTPVRITVLDLSGRAVREARLPAGALEWNWRDPAPPGVYFVSVRAGAESGTRRVVRLE